MNLMLLLLVAATAGATADPNAFRIRNLQEKLLAPCCYSEVVAQHRSDVAAEIRAEIATMVRDGRSDREITDRFRERYGSRILAEPEGTTGLVLWITTLAAFMFGGVVLALTIRRYRTAD